MVQQRACRRRAAALTTMAAGAAAASAQVLLLQQHYIMYVGGSVAGGVQQQTHLLSGLNMAADGRLITTEIALPLNQGCVWFDRHMQSSAAAREQDEQRDGVQRRSCQSELQPTERRRAVQA